MEENNRKGPGVFYAVVGVATLVVAIVGATFAYFSATSNKDTTIQGEAASAKLTLAVAKVSTDADGKLVPLNDADISKAVVGDKATNNQKCKDKNGNTVCQIYSITITNEGTSASEVVGSLTLTANEGSAFTNLKWQLLSGDAASGFTTDTTYNAMATTTLAPAYNLGATGTATATKVYYVAVWISNKTTDQGTEDKGSFTGTVVFNSASGDGLSATFTSTQG